MRTRRLIHLCGVLGVSMLVVAAASCSSSSSSSTTTPDTVPPATTAQDTTPDTVAPDTTAPATAPATMPETTAPLDEATVLVYFLAGEVLHVESRQVPAATPEHALGALLAGPTADEAADGLVTAIPEGTTLNGVTVIDNTITVDLSRVFETGGGTMSMIGRVAQVVFTATQFEGLDIVSFHLDGESITELGGEGIGVETVQRLDNEYVLPLILLETPWPGQFVTQPIQVTGLSNTFEATVNYEVVGPGGVILVEGYLMGDGGNGIWGTFDATLDPLPAGTTGEVTVRLFEVSPENGDHIHVVEAIVQLA